MAIVITDGKQTDPDDLPEPLAMVAARLRDRGVRIVAVGIGSLENLDQEQLFDVAGDRADVVLAEDFDVLKTTLEEITARACPGRCQVPHETHTVRD